MTAPTQAQIEAAWHVYFRHVGPTKERLAAALTAAAEAEPSKMFAYISGKSEGKIAELEAREEYALSHLGSQLEENEKLRAEIAATIERCAQVADTYAKLDIRSNPAKDIAADIRALRREG